LIIKLTPNVTRIEDFARVCEDSGADAVSLVNTYKGLSIDIHKRKSRIGGFSGGLSGPAIKPLALYAVWTVSQNISLPVIGCGGITNSEDAVEFFMVGASLIEIGSATFRNPSAPLKILKGLEDYLEKEGLRSVKDITGIINE
jgi:dihydroorotate dehydrogenase (NAD+) catalytic subunit